MTDLYIGLMSGTSIDGVDTVAASFEGGQFELVGTLSYPIPDQLKQSIQALCQPGLDSLQLYAETDHQLGQLFAQASLALMAKVNIAADQVSAIGSHGQTVRHMAPGAGPIAFSQQIGDPNIIAARTGCPVVADFRRKDMALGGQGAPLVPAFHRELFAQAGKNRVIVNIGGIANITLLPAEGPCVGFDTGPGNVLMDLWSQTHLGTHYDHNGSWAAQGTLIPSLLKQMKADSFFALPAPKSTGRELFNSNWLNSQLADFSEAAPQDIQATLLSLTAESISESILGLPQTIDEVFVCGGGAFNGSLMDSLTAKLTQVATTDALGISPSWVECCAFAWLAKQRMASMAGNLTSVTGATRQAVLGAVYLPD